MAVKKQRKQAEQRALQIQVKPEQVKLLTGGEMLMVVMVVMVVVVVVVMVVMVVKEQMALQIQVKPEQVGLSVNWWWK